MIPSVYSGILKIGFILFAKIKINRLSCVQLNHKAIVVMTRRAHCIYDYIYVYI